MALTDLDFRIATGSASPLSQHPLDLTFLERRSIDLNKHALDLNEAPLNPNCMAVHSTAAPLCVEAHNLSMSNFGLSDATAMSSWPSKSGGWLELFRDMFEPGKNIKSPGSHCPSIPGVIGHNSSNRGSEQVFDRLSGIGKRSRIMEPTCPGLPGQPNKRTRVGEQPLYRLFENSKNSSPFQATVFRRIPEQVQTSRTVGHTFVCAADPHKVLNSFQQTFQPIPPSETPGNGFEQIKFTTDFLSLIREQDKGKNRNEQSLNCSPSHLRISRSLEQTQPRVLKQEEQAFAQGLEQRMNWLPDNQKRGCRSLKEIADGISEKDISSSGCQPALRHRSLQENCLSNGEGKLQILNEDKGATICRNNAPEQSDVQSDSMDAVKNQTPLVQVIESPDWLPANWVTELKTRKTGSTAGTKDKYYKDPVSGHRFRSKVEVMTYLQTGRVSRYRPKVKSTEGVTPILITSHFMPKQDVRSDINNSVQLNPVNVAGGLTVPRLDWIPGLGLDGLERCKSSIRPKSSGSGNDIVRNISAWQLTDPHNLISGKIVLKEENDVFSGDPGVSVDATEGLDALTSVESVLIVTKTELNAEKIMRKEEGFNAHESTIMGSNQQSAGKIHPRKIHGPSITSPGLGFKQQGLSGFQELVRKEGQNIWSTIDMTLQKTETPQIHVRMKADARIAHIKDALLPYDRVAVRHSSQLADISLPLGSLLEMHPGKWPLNNKACVGKAAKLTQREGRELLVCLGRRICRQYLGSVSDTVSHQFKK